MVDRFATRLGDHIEASADLITRQWVELLAERLDEDVFEVLPTDDLLNHIPMVLRQIAAYVRDPTEELLQERVVEDVRALAELRRRQGFGISEILVEYEILSHLIQTEAEEVARAIGNADSEEVVRSIGRLKDSMLLLSSVTARSFRRWSIRQGRERAETISWFGQMLSHELKNRLGAAETAARLLLEAPEGQLDQRRERLYEIIVESIDRALETVADVGSIASSEDGTFPAGPRLPIRVIIEEVVRHMRTEADDRGIRVEFTGCPAAVRADAGHLQVILINLVRNAIRHHEPDRVEPWVRVEAQSVEPEGSVRITVADNGPGLPEHMREGLFDQLIAPRATDQSGLGLPIAREAAAQLGAQLTYDTTPGEGTEFHLLLPPEACG